MKSEKFRVKISIIPFLLSVGIVFLSIFLSFFLKNEALKGGFLILSLFYTITIVINLYNFIFTRLSIKENTLTGFNGIFSRVNSNRQNYSYFCFKTTFKNRRKNCIFVDKSKRFSKN